MWHYMNTYISCLVICITESSENQSVHTVESPWLLAVGWKKIQVSEWVLVVSGAVRAVSMKSAVSWGVTSCGLVGCCQSYEGTCCLHLRMFSTLRMETACCSEILVSVRTLRCHVAEDSNHHNVRRYTKLFSPCLFVCLLQYRYYHNWNKTVRGRELSSSAARSKLFQACYIFSMLVCTSFLWSTFVSSSSRSVFVH
jgi:hypothetical protein